MDADAFAKSSRLHVNDQTRRLRSDLAGIADAAALLRAGELVAFPTETVYGLGGDATNPAAVAGIYAAKGRPQFNPLIAHVSDVPTARQQGRFDPAAEVLAAAFWPGPLTLVLPRLPTSTVCDLATAGLATVALRVPAHAVARQLLAAVGRPIAGPSANRSGRVSPTTAEHVLGDLDGRIAAVLDGGPTTVGVESTIVACLGGPPLLLRPGGVSREELARVLGGPVETPTPASGTEDRPLAPGMLASHYAPRARVRLNATEIEDGEAVLLFGQVAPERIEKASAAVQLSAGGDTIEAAARLFAALRQLDATGVDSIAVAPIPDTGLGEAINDRLRRAAAPR
jgi:L-threonylcarbamoyladenylate synthase